jgi:hypothetical protein
MTEQVCGTEQSMVAQPTSLHDLKAYLQAEAPFLADREGLTSGHASLDRLLSGGFPKGGLVVLSGLSGAGRMTVAAGVLAAETQAGRPVAWIDGRGTLYPPALAALGVVPERLLMIQGAKERSVYATEQIIDSGAFQAVIASGLDAWLTPSRARRLQTAAEGARVCAMLLLEPPAALQLGNAALRLHLTRRKSAIQIEVQKDRAGRSTGHRAILPQVGLAA